MLDIHNELKTNAPDSSPESAGGATKSASLAEMRQSLPGRLWRALQRYPIPFGSVALLVASLVSWLAGRGDIANWILLVVVLLGGIPLLWETFQQFLRREFSVDVIALLAIAGSLLLGEYLAGAFVVLMLSGGEALEAYALRRARSSLSALAERAPRIAHIWRGDELVNIAADQVEVGMEIVVEPGEL